MTDRTVLLVEDSPADVLLIQRAFTRARIAGALAVVGDGEQAVAYLSGGGTFADRDRHPMPDLVLLDLKLPRKSGFEVLEWLRAQPGLRRLPVAVLTSSRETSDVDRAYDAGANSYLVKPGNADDLLTLLRDLGLYWQKNEFPSLS